MIDLTSQQTYYLELRIQLLNSASKRSELDTTSFEWQSLINQEMILLSILKEMISTEEGFKNLLDQRDNHSQNRI